MKYWLFAVTRIWCVADLGVWPRSNDRAGASESVHDDYLRPKSLYSWQSSCKKLASKKGLLVEEKRDGMIGGYFRARLPRA